MRVAGIDIGSEGVRVQVLDLHGESCAACAHPLDTLEGSDGRMEQDPEAWWEATCRCLRSVAPSHIRALAVTSTSGTIAVLDARDRPLRPALLYGDGRAVKEAAVLGVRPTDPPAKILWLRRHEPEVWRAVRRVVHAADFVVARLTGRWATDWSHALKTGYDPASLRWSGVLEAAGMDPTLLPEVLPPATPIGVVTEAAASETGLEAGTLVVTGMTDGCTGQIACGATSPGQWCTVLGSTLVLKGVTHRRIIDPLSRVYCHRHPDGYWMPGGASNAGGAWLRHHFPDADLGALDTEALALTPTGVVVYPLVRTGERFPFVAPEARGFIEGVPQSRSHAYAASLEGVAYVERLGYETLASLGAEVGEVIYTAGGGARSVPWLQIRSDVLGRVLRRPALPGAASGAAILAAVALTGEPLAARAAAMVRIDLEVAPRRAFEGCYEEAYARFVQALRDRGYLPSSTILANDTIPLAGSGACP